MVKWVGQVWCGVVWPHSRVGWRCIRCILRRQRAKQKALDSYIFGGIGRAAVAVKNDAAAASGGAAAIKQTEGAQRIAGNETAKGQQKQGAGGQGATATNPFKAKAKRSGLNVWQRCSKGRAAAAVPRLIIQGQPPPAGHAA